MKDESGGVRLSRTKGDFPVCCMEQSFFAEYLFLTAFSKSYIMRIEFFFKKNYRIKSDFLKMREDFRKREARGKRKALKMRKGHRKRGERKIREERKMREARGKREDFKMRKDHGDPS